MSTDIAVIASQRGWMILGDTDTHTNRIRVRSSSGPNLYTIAQTRKNGIWQCECLGYRRNKTTDMQGRRSCQHLKAVVPVFEATLANPARRPSASTSPTRSAPITHVLPKPAAHRSITIQVRFDGDARIADLLPSYCQQTIESALKRMPGVTNLAVTVTA